MLKAKPLIGVSEINYVASLFKTAKIQDKFQIVLLSMAKKSQIERASKKPKFKSRVIRRCFRCGRRRGYMRKFGVCRICFRELANKGMLPGVKKSSW